MLDNWHNSPRTHGHWYGGQSVVGSWQTPVLHEGHNSNPWLQQHITKFSTDKFPVEQGLHGEQAKATQLCFG